MDPQSAQEMKAVIVRNVLSKEDVSTIHTINRTATTKHNFIPSGKLHKVTFLQSSIHSDDDNDDNDGDGCKKIDNISAFEELGGSLILENILDKIKTTDKNQWNFLAPQNRVILTTSSQTAKIENINKHDEELKEEKEKQDGDSDENKNDSNEEANKYGIISKNVNIRVIEYHAYEKFGGLMQKNHYDGGSILTAVLMLSNPMADFQGGQLMTWEKDERFKIYDNIKQGDMLLFPSHKYHSVSQLKEGERYVMVIELWENMHGNEFDKNRRPGSFGYLIQDSMSSTM